MWCADNVVCSSLVCSSLVCSSLAGLTCMFMSSNCKHHSQLQ